MIHTTLKKVQNAQIYGTIFFRVLIEFLDLFLVTSSKAILSQNPYLGAGTEGVWLKRASTIPIMTVVILRGHKARSEPSIQRVE